MYVQSCVFVVDAKYETLQYQKRELFEENQKLRQELDRSSGNIVTEFEREREEWRKKYPQFCRISLFLRVLLAMDVTVALHLCCFLYFVCLCLCLRA